MQDPENSRNQHEETQEHEYSAEGFQSFAQDTTLHGARFLFVSNVSRRVVWNIAMVSCFSFCAYQVFLSVRDFYSYPFHTTVKRETAPKDGRELPFPAVTLCNLNPANTRGIRQRYSPVFHVTPTEEQLKQSIEDLSHLFARSPKVLTKEFKERNPEFFHRPNSPEEVKEEMKLYALLDQFSFLGNRARYEFIKLDMSTVLGLSIPSSRPLTFPGEQSKNSYRAR